MGSQCASRHPKDGWLCLLDPNHDGDCASFDNRRLWHGTPGFPVRWSQRPARENGSSEPAGHLVSPTSHHLVTRTQVRPALTWSGESCTECGGMRLVRSGTCNTCQDCGSSTGCG